MAEVIEHLPEIGVTVISSWIFNCYIVHDGGDGRPFVVDAGTSGNARSVSGVLREHGSSVGDLACVVATHGHGDHVGGLPALRRGTVDIPIALPAQIKAYREGSTPRAPGAADVLHILPVMADQPFSFAPLRQLASTMNEIGYDANGRCSFPFEPHAWLEDGDEVPGAPDWTVLHTPGHTDDSLSFYNERTRTVLSGDAVLAVGRRPWFNPEHCDAELSATTEKKLRGHRVSHLLPGHGRPVAADDVWDAALSWDERPANSDNLTSIRRIFRSHRAAR